METVCVSVSWNENTVCAFYSSGHQATFSDMGATPTFGQLNENNIKTSYVNGCFQTWWKSVMKQHCQLPIAILLCDCYLFIISSWILISFPLFCTCASKQTSASSCCFLSILFCSGCCLGEKPDVTAANYWTLMNLAKVWMYVMTASSRGWNKQNKTTSKCGLPRQMSTVSYFHLKFEWKTSLAHRFDRFWVAFNYR